jgi:N-acetylglucosaminyldiphosphoundecaprenol N-acetyl-beta-D-mannosaminyltransferase
MPQAVIDEITVTDFPSVQAMFAQVLSWLHQEQSATLFYLNVHVANLANVTPDLKAILQRCGLVYCDGSGIVWASKLFGEPLSLRMPAADWFTDLLDTLAQANKTVYFLAGKPGVAEKAMATFNRLIPSHTIIGSHHGYLAGDLDTEQQVIAEINRLKPDVLIVGMGTPVQERWIARHRDALNVNIVWALGAVLDYYTGDISRCPQWMGHCGLEWLYRFMLEPQRLFGRYIVGNPWFVSRMLGVLLLQQRPWKRVASPWRSVTS